MTKQIAPFSLSLSPSLREHKSANRAFRLRLLLIVWAHYVYINFSIDIPFLLVIFPRSTFIVIVFEYENFGVIDIKKAESEERDTIKLAVSSQSDGPVRYDIIIMNT